MQHSQENDNVERILQKERINSMTFLKLFFADTYLRLWVGTLLTLFDIRVPQYFTFLFIVFVACFALSILEEFLEKRALIGQTSLSERPNFIGTGIIFIYISFYLVLLFSLVLCSYDPFLGFYDLTRALFMIEFFPWTGVIMRTNFHESIVGVYDLLVSCFSATSCGLLLSILTMFLYFLILQYVPKNLIEQKKFLFFSYLGLLCLLICFNTSSFFVFYMFFEFILIPFYFIVGLWGSRINRLSASLRLVFFTVIFSLPLGIFTFLNFVRGDFSFNFEMLNATLSSLDPNFSTYLYIALFLAFAVKIPLFPAHVWLPEAHGEAPTFGSVLLAGILLKLGGYGFIKIFYPLVYELNFDYSVSLFPIIYAISIITILYSNITVFTQTDIKKTIAYYSIGHMGFVTLGLSTGTIEGYNGAMTIMIAHGLSAAGLFFMVGYLYEKSHTRALFAFRGLATTLPYFSVLFFIFVCANMGLPGTMNFAGEQLVIISLANYSLYATILPFIGIFLNGLSSVLFMNRLLFGEANDIAVVSVKDLGTKESFTFSIIVLPLLLFGFFPQLFISLLV